MPVPALDQRHISGVVQRPGDALNHWVNLGRLTLATLKPSAQPYSSRVFWVVITMQSGITSPPPHPHLTPTALAARGSQPQCSLLVPVLAISAPCGPAEGLPA